ncbi:hypothetical protein KXD93_10395 [Mucilaginibacter sp. BJC16-A38]|uniref:hypothetical protein n=1 Tax=Mucilaginibacter phenanthrenivorans TaxID=1234842 RepID=UPI002156FBCC|nr:hypothetical protein [Mucilaginibacter phenanthrenivorans]MCR8558055.1 hypothetical protein [Mucilaginibacter phenanthrenivorans]
MKIRDFRVLTGAFFMFVFCVKMAISVAPIFLNLDDKIANAVINQLEHESKTDKDDLEKDLTKEKKVFDEFYFHSFEHTTFVAETSVLHNLENSLYKQVYHPIVPTPPPNA